MNLLLLGLNTIAALLGYNKFAYYDFSLTDLAIISNQANIELTSDEKSLVGLKNKFDVYTLEGENRYVCFEFDDSYLIYDKADDEVDEHSFTTSPYIGYDDYLCVYVENSDYFTHGYVDDKSIFNLDIGTYLDEVLIEKSIDNNKEDGQYLLFDDYGKDVVKIDRSYYFENLNHYHGSNSEGTCAIVAIQILMGYYDTFYNDNTILEIYDDVATNYNNIIASFTQSPGSGQDFHDELISFASKKDITDNGVGMNIGQEKDLTVKYLTSRNIEFDYKWIEGNWADTRSNAAANHIREAIDNNNPVFVGAAGHATVAYAYDSNYVYVHSYVHSGWGDVRKTPWSTVSTNFWDFWGGPHTVEIQNIKSNHYHSDNYYSSSLKKYLCPCGMLYYETEVAPSDYGFEEQYFFYEKTKDITVDNLTFETKRLRTGYIEEEVINLSPRREDAGLAYLQYNFDNYIRKITVDLSMWSSSENMYTSDSTLLLQYLDPNKGVWVTYYDLLNDINLGTDRYNQDEYIINFPNMTKSFRFYSTSSALGDRNKGRLSIGDMVIEYAPL